MLLLRADAILSMKTKTRNEYTKVSKDEMKDHYTIFWRLIRVQKICYLVRIQCVDAMIVIIYAAISLHFCS